MKRFLSLYYLMLITLLPVCSGLRSQDFFVNAEGERIQACTDRTMYVSGEKVLFSAVIFNEKDLFPEEFSRIFYCELITPAGKKITGGKYLLQNSSGQGCLTIPEETISGIYFLRFYTRFMRNIGTDGYKYIMLKIINPFKTEVLSGKDVIDSADPAGNYREVPAGDQSLVIASGKKTFSPGEEIRFNIRRNTVTGSHTKLCLSVIPEFTFNGIFYPYKKKPDTAKSGGYLPETRGISLSGHLLEKESGKPVPDAKVNLSIIGDKDIQVVRTGSTGRFCFTLPDYHGHRDIFLCAGELPNFSPEILIDNDFCSRPVNLPSPLFTLNNEEMKAAYKLAVNSRITSIFRKDTLAGDSQGEENTVSFYGEPSGVLVMDKYIDLPTVGEYFTELSFGVSLKKVQDRYQLRFYSTQAEMSIYDPLVLVDWVAVDDIEKIVAMPPRNIDRIELVNSLYIKGNTTYGGIISFVSKKNDFAGINLSKSGTFVNYSFLEKCAENISSGPSSINIPDSRNTVYWNPAVQTHNDGTASISFPAPGTPGKYDILLRGMSNTGEVELRKETIVVKAY
ncbi:MAG: hypothetical protein NTX61_02345 [Bacteroidetes bacterium]|nr:hypothetical protein [Bacteroidota bacterium]